MHYYHVLPTLPFDSPFTYAHNSEIAPHTVVEIPFGSRECLGMVVGKVNAPEDISKIKQIIHVYDINIDATSLDFLNKVAQYNIIPKGAVLKMLLSTKEALTKPYSSAAMHQVNDGQMLATLTTEQLNAYQEISNNLGKNFAPYVLEGVTGSGKTEVYLNLIHDVIKNGGQVLVLLPEIVLTSQLVSRFATRFNFQPLQWHSSLTPKQRRVGWQCVYHNDAKFIVGARSALFLPFKNLQLIIVDEEHDQSFKQEEGAIYNARDMAVMLASLLKIPIILASATPSIESLYNCKIGKYKHLELKSRYGQARMPKIQLIDMEKEKNFYSKISQALRSEMIHNLKEHKQSLIFLNRRGYAPVTMCKECLHKILCPHCNFHLVEHKFKKILQCHYCGFQEKHVTKCPNCGSHDKMTSVGAGVEKIEEEVRSFLPEARIALITSDTASSRSKVEELLSSINNHEVDVIIGTQMLTKGLHFSNLELVGVIDADEGIKGGDIRALERTYQLLHQVSGRAGRESDCGKVLIQSSDVNNIVMHSIAFGTTQDFIRSEIADREAAGMPPFSRIVILTIISKNESNNLTYANHLARNIPTIDEVSFLGPSPAPLFLINQHYRHRFVIIANRNINIQKIIKQWVSITPKPHSIKIKIDVDPYSFA